METRPIVQFSKKKYLPIHKLLTVCAFVGIVIIQTGCEQELPVLDHIGGDFTLQSTLGTELKLNDLKGDAVLLFFGFTHCPDYCPTTLARINKILERLGDKQKGVKVLFVGIDVKHDTPEVLRQYLKYYNPEYIGMSGNQEEIDEVLKLFKVVAYRESNGLFAHTTRVYLIDQQSRVRYMYSERDDEKLRKDLLRIL